MGAKFLSTLLYSNFIFQLIQNLSYISNCDCFSSDYVNIQEVNSEAELTDSKLDYKF